jgi:asparagine synthetase B (glutamine-hydrolysing)
MNIDELLIDQIKQQTLDKDVAVLLSGGVDSLSVAFAANRLGLNITAYTFHLKGQSSYDADKAVEVSKQFNWNYKVVEVPTDNLVEDFFRLAKDVMCKKKTHFECCFPFLYVYPEIKEKVVLSGWAADGYYGISKKAILHYGKDKPKSKFDEFRDMYFDIKNQAGFQWHERIARNNDKQVIAPYLSLPVKEFFYNKDWNELNKPFQKHHVVTAFPEFKKFKHKKHINLQLGAGVDKLFEKLLDDKKINFKKRKRIMDLCRDWSKKYESLAILPNQ